MTDELSNSNDSTKENQNQIAWFNDLLDCLIDGEIESGIEAVRAAIKLLERTRKQEKLKMPIYKQFNEYEGNKFEKGDLFYADGDYRKCSETVFVHLGLGDVSIETGSSRSDVIDELFFTQSDERHEIGEGNEKDIGKLTRSPVRIVFDKKASIAVVIEALQKIEASLTE